MKEQISEITIERQYNRAKYVAKSKGHSEIAEDFASWYVIKLLEGKSQHQLLDHAFIDFLRLEYGSAGKRGRVDAILRSRRAKAFQGADETFEEAADRMLASVSVSEWNDQRFAEPERKAVDAGGILNAREAEVWDLYTQDELRLRDIGNIQSCTESRISQILCQCKLKIQNFEDFREMKERIEDGRTLLLVDWIEI